MVLKQLLIKIINTQLMTVYYFSVTREWRGKDKNGAPPESKSVDVEQAKGI